MKKVTLMLIVIMIFLGCNSNAQNTTTAQVNKDTTINLRRSRVENRWTPTSRAESMAEQLNLTEAEKAQVEALLERNAEERAAQAEVQRVERERLRAEREAERTEARELRDKANLANDAELENIIGKEKLDQWKLYIEGNRVGRRGTGRNL